MKKALCCIVFLGLAGGATLLFDRKVEACVAPRWVNDTCSCVFAQVGREGCGTDGRTCTSWGNCQGNVILPH